MTLLVGSTALATAALTWDPPSGVWTRLRLVRSTVGVPRDEREGVVLFEDAFATARSSYLDEGLTTGRYYYYGLFVKAATGWLPASSSYILVSKDWGYTSKLYAGLPEVFKSDDYAAVTDVVVNPEDTFLYKFLAVFGFQLDALRSDTESLRTLPDANAANQAMLPALSAQVGLQYEPEIGTRATRRLIANAIHLWKIKGTVPGVRELASVLTGYVSHVRIGKNLVLDGLDAGPTSDVGRWKGRTNATITYRANIVTDTNPAGDGVRIIKPTAAGAVVVDTNRGDADTLLRRLYAVPVLPNTSYTLSQYVRTPSGAASTAQSQLTWLDASGATIGAVVAGANATLNASWARPTVQATSPATARYAILGMGTGALTLTQTVEHCGVQIEEGAVTAWQCAREVMIYLDPQFINYVGNTSGAAGNATGWSTDVSAATDATLGPYLTKFVPDPIDPVMLVDAIPVTVTGDTLPTPPSPANSMVSTEVWYPTAHMAVAPGQHWTALAEAIPPLAATINLDRYGSVGFRLYSGATLIGYEMSPQVLLPHGVFTPMSHELIVPAGAAYDHIEICIVTEGTCGFRHVALEDIGIEAAFYFDGSTDSPASEFLWQGTPFLSSTYFYDRRSMRTVRLRAMLTDYLPNGSCYDLLFATPVPAASPQSIAGVDADPATSLPL